MRLPHEQVVNRTIDAFAKKDSPSLLDWNLVKSVSEVQTALVAYEAAGKGMSFEELVNESHDSSRLARFMECYGDPRPNNLCDCHAIVSGGDPRAVPMRAVLAWYQLRIDMPMNGVWLPKNTAAKIHMPDKLKRAVPHSRIHRKGYYLWLGTLIDLSIITNDKSLVETLKKIRFKLEHSSFPDYVMLPASKLS